MDSETAAALNRINQQFYALHAEAFSATRDRPWPGWERVAAELDRRLPGRASDVARPRILDAGCGNGRFERFLADRWGCQFHYLGIDSSSDLLRLAERRRRPTRRPHSEFRHGDLMGAELDSLLQDRRFELIAVFGLLHHLPGLDRRRRLLQRLGARLAPGGLLALSFWQFGALERFRQRIIPWQQHNQDSRDRVQLSSLEPGDVLLAWGDAVATGDPSSRRYCHFADPQEARALVSTLGLSRVESFRADGRGDDLNLYFLLAGERS